MPFLVAIFLLSVLIVIHELGHFITAKRAGLLVEEFGIGLPPRLFGYKKGETVYSINWLPFGGFVKIYGESPPARDVSAGKAALEEKGLPAEVPDEGRAFSRQPLRTRLIILLAGVAMNFIFGALILSVLFSVGVPAIASKRVSSGLQNLHVEIIEIARNSPAGAAGLRLGDSLLEISSDGEALNVKDVEGVRDFVFRNAGKSLSVLVKRNGEDLLIQAASRATPPEGQGPLGIAMAEVGILQYPWYRSIWEGVRAAGEIAGNTFAALYFVLKNLVTEGRVGPSIAGPVGIVNIAGEAARMGAIRLLNFAALLTINLAVLNILPIPALDGGRIAFLAVEKIRGKPVSHKIENATHAAGMALLLMLILLLTIYDIRRL